MLNRIGQMDDALKHELVQHDQTIAKAIADATSGLFDETPGPVALAAMLSESGAFLITHCFGPGGSVRRK